MTPEFRAQVEAFGRELTPELLTGTDLRGAALPGLRRPSSRSSTYSISIRRGVKGSSFLTRGLLDPLALSVLQGDFKEGDAVRADVRVWSCPRPSVRRERGCPGAATPGHSKGKASDYAA